MAAQVWEMGGDGRQGSGLAVGGLGRRRGERGLQAAITGLSAGRTRPGVDAGREGSKADVPGWLKLE